VTGEVHISCLTVVENFTQKSARIPDISTKVIGAMFHVHPVTLEISALWKAVVKIR